MAILLAAAAACVFLFVVVVATLQPQQAVRLCSVLALFLLLLVPVNRLTGEALSLRTIIPLAVAALTCLAVFKAGRFSIRAFPWIFLYLAVALTATLGASSGGPGILLWGLSAFTVMTGVFQGAALKATNNVAWFSRAFVICACISAIYSVFEILSGAEPLWRGALIAPDGQSTPLRHPIFEMSTRAQATFGHPLPFALVLVLALALVLTTPIKSKTGRFITLSILTAGLLAAGSRNALVLAALLVLYLGVRRLQSMRVPGYLALVVASIAGLLQFFSSDVISSGSFTHRIGAFESVGRLFTERSLVEALFGSGAGGTTQLFAKGLLQDDGFQAIDNQYVHTFATEGLVGLGLLIFVWGAAFRVADSRWRIALGVLAAEGMIFDFLAWPTTGYLAWVIIGIALTRGTPSVGQDQSLVDRQKGRSAAQGSLGLSFGTR